MKLSNIFDSIPQNLGVEVFEDILKSPNLRIERIISKGQSSPEVGWYDQEESEWVIVLEGRAVLEFEEGGAVTLGKGDYLNIPAHSKHKVNWERWALSSPSRPASIESAGGEVHAGSIKRRLPAGFAPATLQGASGVAGFSSSGETGSR